MFRALLILIFAAVCGVARAHTVPVIVIEAEFTATREAVVKVNLDPRLFLHPVPTSVPAVPASWWFSQDDAAKEKTKQQAVEYVTRTLAFNVGTTALEGEWKVQPIDSVSAFPIAETSTEVHLLAECHRALPSVPGDFKVTIDKKCAVAVILLNSNAGDAERRPQSLFPGETSRGFPLPVLPQPSPSPAAPASKNWLSRNLPAIGICTLVAALLGFVLRPRRSPSPQTVVGKEK